MSDRLTEDVIKLQSRFNSLKAEVGKVLVGQDDMLHRLLLGMLAGGHVLLEGVPGLAKTLVIKTLANAIDGTFSRIQFTPDMLPSDIVGTQIYNPREGTYTAKKGPVFGNFVLADEINRAPAKVQSALLEAMQERQVTLGDQTFKLADPFLVLATQNPIEQEGTYPLPEAQVDRFLMLVKVGYPTREEERSIIDRMVTRADTPKAEPVATLDDIRRARDVVREVYLDEKVKDYIVALVFATREPDKAGIKEFAQYIEYGASPRASLALAQASRAHAFLRGRGYVTPEDVKAIGLDVLRHRLVLTYEADAEQVTAEHVVKRIFEAVEVP